VYNLLDVKIESMFDNGKGRMIQRTDILFLVSVGIRGNSVGARRRASKSGSRGGGSREWRRGRVNYGMEKKLRQSSFLRVVLSWHYLRHLESYCTRCHLKTN